VGEQIIMNTIQSGNETFHAGASFRIQGVDLDMEAITRELGHTPTHRHRRGEPAPIGKWHTLDMWQMESPLGKGQDLELHLNWLAEQLLPHKQYIISLSRKYKVDFYCYKTPYTEQASLTLSPNALRLFTELSLNLCVSLIFIPDEPEETAASIPSRAAQH